MLQNIDPPGEKGGKGQRKGARELSARKKKRRRLVLVVAHVTDRGLQSHVLQSRLSLAVKSVSYSPIQVCCFLEQSILPTTITQYHAKTVSV